MFAGAIAFFYNNTRCQCVKISKAYTNHLFVESQLFVGFMFSDSLRAS